MDNATILIGFAQIAISLAAFTTIASVVVQISESTSENLLAVRLKTILLMSMQLIVLAVSPLVFYQVTPEGDLFWRYAAGAALISGALVAYISFFLIIPKVLKDPKNSWPQTIGGTVFGTASLVAVAVCILRDNPAFWYVAAMVLTLGASLFMVIGLILSFPVFDVHRKKASPPANVHED